MTMASSTSGASAQQANIWWLFLSMPSETVSHRHQSVSSFNLLQRDME
jgi:hypothetical protein